MMPERSDWNDPDEAVQPGEVIGVSCVEVEFVGVRDGSDE
jgi:hypothetical protein